MKNVNSVSGCVDPLVYQYITTSIHLCTEDVTKRPFTYSFDIFIGCTDLRHVTVADTLSLSITTASVTSISTLYHSPIKFSPVFPINLISPILLLDPNYRVVSFPVISSSNITWISFDSVINSFESISFTQEYNILQHFICESIPLHFSIATTIYSNASIYFFLFQQFLPSL